MLIKDTFISSNIIVSARVYLLKRQKAVMMCKCMMNRNDGQVYFVCTQEFSSFFEYNSLR